MQTRNQTIRVLLAEDHTLVREGTRQMLEQDERISVLGEAADGPAAIELTRDLKPDVLLLDLSLPVANGIEVTEAVRRLPEPPHVLILSAYDDSDYVSAALAAGAGGYLLKTVSSQDVLAAILAVSRGDVVLHPAVARKALGPHAGGDVPTSLTERELDVLRHAAHGLKTREIAEALSLSTRTVESHLTSIYNKLGVTGRTAAVVHAATRGWVTIDDGT